MLKGNLNAEVSRRTTIFYSQVLTSNDFGMSILILNLPWKSKATIKTRPSSFSLSRLSFSNSSNLVIVAHNCTPYIETVSVVFEVAARKLASEQPVGHTFRDGIIVGLHLFEHVPACSILLLLFLLILLIFFFTFLFLFLILTLLFLRLLLLLIFFRLLDCRETGLLFDLLQDFLDGLGFGLFVIL